MNNRSDILLHDVTQNCQQLLGILQDEYQALSLRDYQKLMSMAQAKQILVERLSDLDEQVRNSPMLLQHPQWPELRNQIQHCQQQNARNGQLLNRSYQFSRETLGILTGQSHRSDTTYTANGIKQSTAPSLGNITA